MGSIIFIVPPLCITKEQLDEGLQIVDRSIEFADRSLNVN
jgi:4-aminobutyrate aminotransferase-like enzyme